MLKIIVQVYFYFMLTLQNFIIIFIFQSLYIKNPVDIKISHHCNPTSSLKTKADGLIDFPIG